jgi:hypothetical protein
MHSIQSLNQQVNAAALSTSQYMRMSVAPAHLTIPWTKLCLGTTQIAQALYGSCAKLGIAMGPY